MPPAAGSVLGGAADVSDDRTRGTPSANSKSSGCENATVGGGGSLGGGGGGGGGGAEIRTEDALPRDLLEIRRDEISPSDLLDPAGLCKDIERPLSPPIAEMLLLPKGAVDGGGGGGGAVGSTRADLALG